MIGLAIAALCTLILGGWRHARQRSSIVRRLGRSFRSPIGRWMVDVLACRPGVFRKRRQSVDWAVVLAEISRSYRAGDSLLTALGEQPACADAAQRWRLGAPVGVVLRPSACAEADERLTYAALRAVAEVGGSGALALDRAADTIRDRQTLRGERKAQAAQARASAWVLSAVGPLFATWTVSSDARVRAFLFGSPSGVLCLGVGAALNAGGWLWMRRIVAVR